MNNAQSTETCAHTPCKCPRPSDDEYCSLHCRNAAGGHEKNCSCGHPECLWLGRTTFRETFLVIRFAI